MEEIIGRVVIVTLVWFAAALIGFGAPVVATAAILTAVVVLV